MNVAVRAGLLAAVVSLLAGQASSADPVRAEPIRTKEAKCPGVFRVDATELAEGRVVERPAPGSTVVRCARQGDAETQLLDFESSSDGSELVFPDLGPPSGAGGDVVLIETAGATGQEADGRIVLLASDAAEAADDGAIVWTFDATRWGRYSVQVTFAGARGDRFAVEVDGTELSADPKEAISPGRFTTESLGELYLAEAGRHSVTLRAPGVEPVAVLLVPACEGTPPAQKEAEPITLHGRDATVRGTVLRYEPAAAKQTLGYWVRPTDAAEWRFTVETPGLYEVEVLQGCGAGQGGSEVVVSAAGRELTFTVKDTGHFQNFEARTVGRLEFPKPGPYRLTVAPRRIAAKAALDLRQVRLVRVDD